MVRVQVVWNSKMREEVLAQMEAARANPDKAGTAQGFRFEALQVHHLTNTTHLVFIPDVSIFIVSFCSIPGAGLKETVWWWHRASWWLQMCLYGCTTSSRPSQCQTRPHSARASCPTCTRRGNLPGSGTHYLLPQRHKVRAHQMPVLQDCSFFNVQIFFRDQSPIDTVVVVCKGENIQNGPIQQE